MAVAWVATGNYGSPMGHHKWPWAAVKVPWVAMNGHARPWGTMGNHDSAMDVFGTWQWHWLPWTTMALP